MSEKKFEVDTETLLKLLVCVATSDRGWTDGRDCS